MELYTSLFVDKTNDNINKYFKDSKIKFAIKEMAKKYDDVNDLFIK